MHKIALLAGPGAGKTTLANALTAHMKDAGKKWYNIPEYAREFIDKHGAAAMNRISIPLIIAHKQIGREHRVPKHADGFVTDSPLILPWFYARRLPAEPVEKYETLTSLYQMFLRSFLDYTLIVQVIREKEYVEDGTRYQTRDEAVSLDHEVAECITSHGFTIFPVYGTLSNRVQMIVDEINRRDKALERKACL